MELVKLIVEYSEQHNVILNINKVKWSSDIPILKAIKNNNIEIYKLLFEYVKRHNIILNINEKNYRNEYPILEAFKNNNVEMVRIMVEYTLKSNIIIKFTRLRSKEYPFSVVVISNNNIEMTQLIIEYIIKTNKCTNLIKEEVMSFTKLVSKIDIPLKSYENLIKIKNNKKYVTYKRYINLNETKPRIKRKNDNESHICKNNKRVKL